MIFKSDAKPSELNGFLDAGSHLQGELRFETSFRVDGKFSGTVVSEGDLMVGASGELEGELRVGRVFVSGTIRGNIQAQQRVQIAAGGRVLADVDTPSLVIEDGAIFEGRCSMAREERGAEAVAVGGSGGGGSAAVPKLVPQKATAR